MVLGYNGTNMKSMTVIEAAKQSGQSVSVRGWVHNVRDLGKIVFIDLRDHTGVLQIVGEPGRVPKIGTEFVVEAIGKIRARDAKFVNPKLATGRVEMALERLEVLNPSAELPFEIRKDTSDINEEIRLQYRYLDLRSERMAANLRLRYQVTKVIRDFFDAEDFIEVETPMLTKGTPEGAREFVVPSRLHPGDFYVLPQSPQQFKQLLMVGGVGKYFQIARCLRDEDQRGDRQPEFTQLDLEMSFVEAEDVMSLNERLMIELVKKVTPAKKIVKTPFPRLTYAEAIEKYQTDKPDLRTDQRNPDELAFAWITDFPLFDKRDGKLDAVHHPFTSPQPEEVKNLDKDPLKVRSNSYDLVLNGYEIGGGSIRIHDADLQRQIFKILGLSDKDIELRFGHMLEAFKYGVPPHGGIAYGLDRLVMILAGEPNIREVMTFPKTGDGRDPLTGAPAPLTDTQLKDAHIQVVPPKPGKQA